MSSRSSRSTDGDRQSGTRMFSSSFPHTREANIFMAVDAMIEGRAGVAIGQVHLLLQAGRPAAFVLAMMARQVRLLILAKELKSRRVPQGELGGRLGLAGYPLRKTLEQAGKTDAQRLVDMHRRLVEADLSIKSTGADEELILDVLIAESSPSPSRRRS